MSVGTAGENASVFIGLGASVSFPPLRVSHGFPSSFPSCFFRDYAVVESVDR